MKRKYILVIVAILAFVILFYYDYKQNKSFEVYTYNDTRPIELLKKLVVEKNDTVAYNELGVAYQNENVQGEYLYYSLMMANRCNYPPAYFYVYYELFRIESINEQSIFKETTRKFMIKYLKKGASLGHSQSKYELGKLYIEGIFLPKDTILGRKLINSSNF